MSDSKPADPKEGDSFFRKVARFVANPTTDWSEINSRQDDPEGDLAKAELRAMVERKRRNDFVRKRELDMLRRIRREGLTPEQLAALASSPSRLGDEDRISEPNSKIDLGVKAKIDEIEQQMVGESFATTQAVPKQQPGFFETPTRPAAFASTIAAATARAGASASSPRRARCSACRRPRRPPPSRWARPFRRCPTRRPAGCRTCRRWTCRCRSRWPSPRPMSKCRRSCTTPNSTKPSSPSRMPTTTPASVR
jgi:hypothetical protein